MLFELFENSLYALILVGILLVSTVALCIYYIRLLKIKPTKESLDLSVKKPISVVIATRNEHEQLRQNLPFFLNQDHPEFEVVVVIDGSDRDVVYIMNEFKKTHANLKVVEFEWAKNFFVSRKFAESVGIKSAKYDRILQSHIGTRPCSPHWISQMSRTLTDRKEIVIGYHALASKTSFSNALIRFDTFFYKLRYLRSALSGHPFTANRKNLAFDRTLFYKTKGRERFYNINTGDDSMFVNKAATRTNTSVETHANAFVKDQDAITFDRWFARKIRQRILMGELRFGQRLSFALHNWFMALFYLSFLTILTCFLLPETSWFALTSCALILVGGVAFVKFLIQFLVFNRMMNIFQERGFLLLIPLFDFIKLFISPILFFTGLFTKRITWK